MRRYVSLIICFAFVFCAILVPLSVNASAVSSIQNHLFFNNFQFYVYDNSTWDIVYSAFGSSFSYQFIGGNQYTIRIGTPDNQLMNMHSFKPGSSISWNLNVSCSASSYTPGVYQTGILYYTAKTEWQGQNTVNNYGIRRFNSLPTVNMGVDISKGQQFQVVNDFNYFSVPSTQIVTFSVSTMTLYYRFPASVMDYRDYVKSPFNDGVNSGYDLVLPSDQLTVVQTASPTGRFLKMGDEYYQFSISGNNLVNPPPDNAVSSVPYTENGYDFLLYLVGNNLFKVDDIVSGTRLSFGLSVLYECTNFDWSSLFEYPSLTIQYFDADGNVLGSQVVYAETISETYGEHKFLVDVTLQVPYGTTYLDFALSVNDFCPLYWTNGDWIRFKIDNFNMTVSYFNYQGDIDNLGGIEDSLMGNVFEGFLSAIEVQVGAFSFLSSLTSAFLAIGSLFNLFADTPFFHGVLYFSLAIGSIGMILNIGFRAVKSFSKRR